MEIEILKEYRGNGNLRYECSYKINDGFGHGIQKFWNENGSMDYQYSARNDSFHGTQITFNYGN